MCIISWYIHIICILCVYIYMCVSITFNKAGKNLLSKILYLNIFTILKVNCSIKPFGLQYISFILYIVWDFTWLFPQIAIWIHCCYHSFIINFDNYGNQSFLKTVLVILSPSLFHMNFRNTLLSFLKYLLGILIGMTLTVQIYLKELTSLWYCVIPSRNMA